MVTARTRLCMVIGDPVEHSLSPLLHNSGYRALGIDDEFVYVGVRISPDKLADFVSAVRTFGIRGVSCTMPHKEAIMPFLDSIDPIAQQIGAANTVIQEDGKLVGYNTDWEGVVTPLTQLTPLIGKRVAVIGAGGAAKAAVYGLAKAGADVTVYNRTAGKAETLAKQFGCIAGALDDLDGLRTSDIICNMTPLGMGADGEALPIPASCLHARQIVFDAVYDPPETPLLRTAHAAGAQTVSGAEMLLHQAFAQFALYTGRPAPSEAMRKALYDHLERVAD